MGGKRVVSGCVVGSLWVVGGLVAGSIRVRSGSIMVCRG